MTDRINDGGPAFAGGVMPHPTNPNKVTPIAQLTVRDWFAGQALMGMNLGTEPAENAEWAYKIADAMLEARK